MTTAYATPASTAATNTFNGSVGYRFTVGSTPISITAVGGYVDPSTPWSADKIIELWDDTSALLQSHTIHIGDTTTLVGQSRMATLGTPWGLSANTTYRLVCDNYAVDKFIQTGTGPTFNGGGLIADNGECYSGAPGLWPANNLIGTDIFSGGTFQFQAASAVLAAVPTTATTNYGATPVSITANLSGSSAGLTASVSGGGTLSTSTPTNGVPFTYTPPPSGSSTITPVVTITDATDSLTATCTITVNAQPVAIGALSVTANDPTGITIGWTKSGGAAAITTTLYRFNSAPFTPPGTGTALVSGTSASSFKDTTAAPGTVYFYRAIVTDGVTSATSAQTSFEGALPAQIRSRQRIIGYLGDSLGVGFAGGVVPLDVIKTTLMLDPTLNVLTNNQAISGTGTPDWLPAGTNLPAAVTSLAASNIDTLFFAWGMNDLHEGPVSQGTYISNYEAIITYCIAHIPTLTEIVLVETSFPTPGTSSNTWVESSVPLALSYNAALPTIAAAFTGKKTIIVKGILMMVQENPSFLNAPNDVHLSAAGYTAYGQVEASQMLAAEAAGGGGGSSGGTSSPGTTKDKDVITLQTGDVSTAIIVHLADATNTPVAGTPTVTISKNGAAYATPAGAVTSMGNGDWSIAGNSADRNTPGQLRVLATLSGALNFNDTYLIKSGKF